MTGLQQKQKPWKSSKQNPAEMRINITISEGIDQSAILDVSDSSLETGVLWYYNAESCRYVVGDYTNSYHALLVLHFEDGTVYLEEDPCG